MNLTPLRAPRWLAALALVALSGCGIDMETPPASVKLACPDPLVGCDAHIGDRAARIGLTGDIRALRPFQVWVAAAGAREVKANFEMVGMNMGINRYSLRPDASGTFRAQVTLPTCISGRNDWIMTVEVDRAFRVSIPFTARP